MAEYDNSVAIALRLITKKGKDVVFSTKGLTTPDADEPWNKAKGTPAAVGTAKGVQISLERRYANRENIRETDIQLLVAASGLGFTPSQEHTVTLGSNIYQIVFVDTLEPGDQTILFTIIARG